MNKKISREEYRLNCPNAGKLIGNNRLCYKDNPTKDIPGCFGDCEYMRNYNISLLKNKVIFIDLDGTLINTISGETFPKGVWDMKFNFALLDTLKECQPVLICIVTNQGGIGKYVNEVHFMNKFSYIKDVVREYVGCKCEGMYCGPNHGDNFRKPNTGMLEYFSMIFTIEKDDCIMIGDASGLEGQFSDSDKKCAENFGIPYFDVNDITEKNIDKDLEILIKDICK